MTPDEPGAIKPGMGRGIEIRGVAQLLTVNEPPVNPACFSHDIIRIHPQRIVSWRIDPFNPDGEARDIPQGHLGVRKGQARPKVTSRERQRVPFGAVL